MTESSGTTGFEAVSILLPVMDETDSLRQTVETILADCSDDVSELLVIVCDRTTPESMAICDALTHDHPDKVRIMKQELPFLGGAMRDGFDAAKGSHVLLMATDLETPPDRVKEFVAEAKQAPDIIIAGSRWLKGGGFEGYNPLKFLLNFLFQRFFAVLYRCRLTDMTYAYRIYPLGLVQSIEWEELRHPFLFECLVKPLRLGVKVKEIPTQWKSRTQGESQNTFVRNFVYFRIGLKTLFYSRKKILRKGQARFSAKGTKGAKGTQQSEKGNMHDDD